MELGELEKLARIVYDLNLKLAVARFAEVVTTDVPRSSPTNLGLEDYMTSIVRDLKETRDSLLQNFPEVRPVYDRQYPKRPIE